MVLTVQCQEALARGAVISEAGALELAAEPASEPLGRVPEALGDLEDVTVLLGLGASVGVGVGEGVGPSLLPLALGVLLPVLAGLPLTLAVLLSEADSVEVGAEDVVVVDGEEAVHALDPAALVVPDGHWMQTLAPASL